MAGSARSFQGSAIPRAGSKNQFTRVDLAVGALHSPHTRKLRLGLMVEAGAIEEELSSRLVRWLTAPKI